jgi:LPXTG-site transpeptidase (sortase) family protein
VVVAGRVMMGQAEMSMGTEELLKYEKKFPGRFYGIAPINIDQDIKKSAAELEKAIENNVLIIPGNIFSHRDTHFAFLETLNPGQPLAVQLADGSQQHFQISRQQVINSQHHPLHIPRDDQQLILITCYPFGALTPGGPLRYVVTATSAPTSNTANNQAEQ